MLLIFTKVFDGEAPLLLSLDTQKTQTCPGPDYSKCLFWGDRFSYLRLLVSQLMLSTIL